MRLDCPNGHAACIRHDPKGTGMMAHCDTCGWSAPFAVVREAESFAPEVIPATHGAKAQLGSGHQDEQGTSRSSSSASSRRA